jgi:hypothetical protein
MSRKTQLQVVCIVLAVCLHAAWGPVAPVLAGNWAFRRSYYSHTADEAADDSPASRSAYRQPWVGTHPRFTIRGGWRFNTYTLQNGLGSSDRTFFRESWADVNY